jgi:hypothetical protein
MKIFMHIFIIKLFAGTLALAGCPDPPQNTPPNSRLSGALPSAGGQIIPAQFQAPAQMPAQPFLTWRQQQNILRMAHDLADLRAGPLPSIRQRLVVHILRASELSGFRPTDAPVMRLVNNLSVALFQSNMIDADILLLSRNLHLVLNQTPFALDPQAQFLINQTVAVLQGAGIAPQDLQLIFHDLVTIAGELQMQVRQLTPMQF